MLLRSIFLEFVFYLALKLNFTNSNLSARGTSSYGKKCPSLVVAELIESHEKFTRNLSTTHTHTHVEDSELVWTNLEGTHQGLIDTHHGTSVVKLSTVIWS